MWFLGKNCNENVGFFWKVFVMKVGNDFFEILVVKKRLKLNKKWFLKISNVDIGDKIIS